MLNFKDEPKIKKVDFDGITYYSVKDVEKFYNMALPKVKSIILPLLNQGVRENTPCATFEDIDAVIDKTKLSEFNEKLKKALNWNQKNKPD